jgi:hypothetical protein
MKPPTVSRKFSSTTRRQIVRWLNPILESTLIAADQAALEVIDWPVSISPMTVREMREDEKVGGGHGVYLSDTRAIRLKASMPWMGLMVNLIHELWHHVDPGATEENINDTVVPLVYEIATGESLEPKDWEKWRGHNWRNVRRKRR